MWSCNLSSCRKYHTLFQFLIILYLLSLFASSFAQEVIPTEIPSESSTTTLPPDQPQKPQGVADPEPTNTSPITSFVYIIAIAVSCMLGLIGFMAAGICWYRHTKLLVATERVLYRSSDSSILIHNSPSQPGHGFSANGTKSLSDMAKQTDYPAYGVTGPNPLYNQDYEPPIDSSLNHNAEVLHYNQTKKKMRALSNGSSGSISKESNLQDVAAELQLSDEETSEGEYTVYECSGFASMADGPMEIHNPLFEDMSSKTRINGEFSYSDVGNGYQQNSVNDFAQTRTSN